MNELNRKATAAKAIFRWVAAAALAWPILASAQGAKSLEGTWEIEVTLRNCATNDAIRSFPRMITFHKGGTLSEFAAGGTEAMPAARAPGQGHWEYLGDGAFTYSLKFLRLTSFGGPDGSVAETRLLEVNKNGDSYSADGTATITLANGVKIQACASEAGKQLY